MTHPQPQEYTPYFQRYIDQVAEGPIDQVLENQRLTAVKLFESIDESKSLYRYEQHKWSIKQVLGHILDTERIFAYRALRIARGDVTPLPSFQQDPFVAASQFDALPWTSLVGDFNIMRPANQSLFRLIPESAWQNIGTAAENSISARACVYVLAGHCEHHMRILRELYL